MNKWYILENDGSLPAAIILLLEKDGRIFEKFIEDYDGKSIKIVGDMHFPNADTSEKFAEFVKKYPKLVREVTEGEAFALIL